MHWNLHSPGITSTANLCKQIAQLMHGSNTWYNMHLDPGKKTSTDVVFLNLDLGLTQSANLLLKPR